MHFLDIYQTPLVNKTFKSLLQMLVEAHGLEYSALDRLMQTFTVCIEDPIDKVKWCAADNKSIGSNLLIKKHCLKARE